MVCEWGMSERVGPLNYSDGDNNPFLGDGGLRTHRPYSESVAKEIDAEVKRIVTEQHDLAIDLLRENHDLLELMAQALLEFEALNADEIDLLLEQRNLDGVREKREADEREAAEREEERAPKKGFSSKLKEKKQNGSFGDLSPTTNS